MLTDREPFASAYPTQAVLSFVLFTGNLQSPDATPEKYLETKHLLDDLKG